MAQQWRIRISGTQRADVDVGLLIQAVIALGQQLRVEKQEQKAGASPPGVVDVPEKGACS